MRDRLQTEVRLHVEAAEVWKTLERELDGPLDIHFTGGLMVAETADELRLLHDKRVIEEEAGLDIEILEGDDLRAFAPYLADDLTGASFCPQEGHANPALAVPLFALRAVAGRRRGSGRTQRSRASTSTPTQGPSGSP